MKRKLTSLVVLCGVVQCAWANAAVTTYGVVDAGLVVESGGANGRVAKLGSGIQNGSRIGFKGTEDLGSGLSALFVLESGANIDTGTMGQGGLLFGRQALVGIKHAQYGTVTLGRQYAPLFDAVARVDPFLGGSLAGSSNNLLSVANLRMNNTVKYVLPAKNGINGELAYGFGEVPGDSSAGRQIGATLGYTSGPLDVKVSFHGLRTVPTTTVSSSAGRSTFVGATYVIAGVKAALGFEVNKGAVTINGTARSGVDSRDFLVGATVPFGPHAFLVSFINKDDRSTLDRDAKQIAIGYTYALSKRTNLYAAYARIKNDAPAGTPGFYTVGNASDKGTGDKAFNFGIRHVF